MTEWAIQSDNGPGWMRFEDYCDSRERGTGYVVTSCVVNADEELLVHELGQRVVNSWLEWACLGWDALADLSYQQWCETTQAS